MREGQTRPNMAPAVLALLLVAGCAAGDPLGLYHPYHEPYASDAERGAAFAAHHVAYGTHENCSRRLAGFVSAEEADPGGHVADPVRLSANEAVGYRRFGAEGEAVIQEYRCIDGTMHFRAWAEAGAPAHH
jgi:hypothetical protein